MVRNSFSFLQVFAFSISLSFFIYLFLLTSPGFFELGEVFGQTCSSADSVSGKTVCGHEVGALVNKGIYVCEFRSAPQSAPGYYWEHTGRTCGGSEECVGGDCFPLETEPRDCVGGSAAPPARSWPSASHGESVCTTSGTSFSYTCNDGQWSSEFCGESGCSNGRCGDESDESSSGGGDSGGGSNDGGSSGGGSNGGGSSGGGSSGGITSGGDPPQLDGIWQVIYSGVKFFFGFIAVIAAAMIVYGAYMWMASGGDPQKTKMAQGVLTWAIIGLIFFMIIPFFFDFILSLFGIQLPTPSGTGFF